MGSGEGVTGLNTGGLGELNNKIDKIAKDTDFIATTIKGKGRVKTFLEFMEVIFIPLILLIFGFYINSTMNKAEQEFQAASQNAILDFQKASETARMEIENTNLRYKLIEIKHELAQSLFNDNPYVSLQNLSILRHDLFEQNKTDINQLSFGVIFRYFAFIEDALDIELNYQITLDEMDSAETEFFIESEDVQSKIREDANKYLSFFSDNFTDPDNYIESPESDKIASIVSAFEIYDNQPTGILFCNIMYRNDETRHYLSRSQIALRLEEWMLYHLALGDYEGAVAAAYRIDEIFKDYRWAREITQIFGSGYDPDRHNNTNSDVIRFGLMEDNATRDQLIVQLEQYDKDYGYARRIQAYLQKIEADAIAGTSDTASPPPVSREP